MRRLFGLVCLVVPLVVAAAGEPERLIVFHPIKDPAIADFAISFYKDEMGDTDPWRALVQTGVIKFTLVDIDDDGIPELFLQLDEPGWCGSAGCHSDIFKRTAAGYKHICSISLPEPSYVGDETTGAVVLPEKENGLHLLDLGRGTVVHWPANEPCWSNGD